MTFAYNDVFRGIKTSLRFAAHARAKNIKRVKIVTKVATITTIVLVVGWIYQILYVLDFVVMVQEALPFTSIL